MKERINSYIAMLLVTIAGAGAAVLIIHVAYVNEDAAISLMTTSIGGENYFQLQQSLLKQ